MIVCSTVGRLAWASTVVTASSPPSRDKSSAKHSPNKWNNISMLLTHIKDFWHIFSELWIRFFEKKIRNTDHSPMFKLTELKSWARRSFSSFNFSINFSLWWRRVSISSRGFPLDCSNNAMWASFSAIAATNASCLWMLHTHNSMKIQGESIYDVIFRMKAQENLTSAAVIARYASAFQFPKNATILPAHYLSTFLSVVGVHLLHVDIPST